MFQLIDCLEESQGGSSSWDLILRKVQFDVKSKGNLITKHLSWILLYSSYQTSSVAHKLLFMALENNLAIFAGYLLAFFHHSLLHNTCQ